MLIMLWVVAALIGACLVGDGNQRASHWTLGTGWLILGMCLMSLISWIPTIY